MFEAGTAWISVYNIESCSSLKHFYPSELEFLPMQNSYCDHRNFDSDKATSILRISHLRNFPISTNSFPRLRSYTTCPKFHAMKMKRHCKA